MTTNSEPSTSSSSDNLCQRKKEAYEMQKDFYNLFGFNNEIIWDCYEEGDKEALVRKVKLVISNDDDNAKTNDIINKIVESIWNQRKYNGGSALLMSLVFVLSVKYETYKDHIRNADNSTVYNVHPLFRVRKCVKNEDSHNCCMLFVDEDARVYANWVEYLNNNTLPKAIIIAPQRGIYTIGAMDFVLLERHITPACSPGKAVVKAADIGTTVASLGSTGILIASAFAAPIAAPVLAGAVIVGVSCGAYSLLRGSFSLFDRFKHEQSISLADAEARGNWLGIAGGIAGVAAGGAARGVAYLARNGQEIGLALRAGVNILNATAIATNGAGVVNGFFNMYIRFQDDGSFSTLDVVQLSASLFLFTHSVYNFQTASRIIRTSQESAISSVREDLSRNQKRAFDKMSKETVRLRGGEAGRSDIIRGLKNIPDQREYFRDVYKINKELNRNNIKISFANDGTARLNAADSIKPAELRAQLQKNSPAGVFANIPDNPEVSLVNVNSELNLTSPSIVDNASFVKLLLNIGTGFKVLSCDDLRTNIINILENLTIDAFNLFFDFVKNFISENGDTIQKTIGRIIPFETFLNDIFKLCVGFAEGGDVSDFIERNLDDLRPIIIEAIKQFYDQFRPKGTDQVSCKLCGGKYYVD